MDFRIEYCGGCFIATTSGDAEVEKFGVILDAILRHVDWKFGMPYIMDHSDLNAGPVTAKGIKRIAQLARERRAKMGVKKSAIIAPRDLEYGLARMWLVIVDDEIDVTTKIFRTRKDAIAWITA